MTKFYVILGVVAVLGVGAVGYSVGSKSFGSTASEPVDVEGLDDPQTLVDMAKGMTKGDESAPITIVEFGDYQCPGCGVFALNEEPAIVDAFVETGQAKFVFYDFPLISIHAHSFLAARATRCAGDQSDEAYWDYHETLFRHQGEWPVLSDPTARFVEYADELGLDAGAFESCVRSDAHAATVTANLRLGEMLGINQTPTVMVSQGQGMARRVGRNTLDGVRQAIEDLRNPGGGE